MNKAGIIAVLVGILATAISFAVIIVLVAVVIQSVSGKIPGFMGEEVMYFMQSIIPVFAMIIGLIISHILYREMMEDRRDAKPATSDCPRPPEKP